MLLKTEPIKNKERGQPNPCIYPRCAEMATKSVTYMNGITTYKANLCCKHTFLECERLVKNASIQLPSPPQDGRRSPIRKLAKDIQKGDYIILSKGDPIEVLEDAYEKNGRIAIASSVYGETFASPTTIVSVL